MQTDIIFLDITDGNNPPTPPSPNTWKVRIALNLKKLKYTTQWVGSLEIEPTLKELGVPPSGVRPNGSPHYTLPAIIDRTNPDQPIKLADSTPIIEYLEKHYPTPGLDLCPEAARPLLYFLEEKIVLDLIHAPFRDLMVGGFYNLTPPEKKELVGTVLEAYLGTHPSVIEKQGEEREAAWAKVEVGLGAVAKAYEKSPGLFIVPGSSPTVADLRIVSWIIYMRVLHPEETWQKVSSWHGGRWVKLVEYFVDYIEVDGRKIF